MSHRLTKEREEEIRTRLIFFKIHHAAPLYEETHGPDMEALLAEIDALREENQQLHDIVVKISEIGQKILNKSEEEVDET